MRSGHFKPLQVSVDSHMFQANEKDQSAKYTEMTDSMKIHENLNLNTAYINIFFPRFQ